MAEIRLEHVTRTFAPGKGIGFLSTRGARTAYRDFEDKAFVERAASHEVATASSSEPIRALDDLSLTIEDGETMAIVGPSGCGKSTLLRVVAGLETLDEGHVYYDDVLMDDVAPKDRDIAMVFQNYALYPHMKGEGNLGFFFRVRKRPPQEMMERIQITADIMGIGFDVLLSRKPGILSGGQQQRVAIGRCIVRDPSLFLFDEPLSNLDAKLRTGTRIEIKRLLHRFNITAIYVTHDQTEAITLGDRIAVMRSGIIEQVGTYQEIVDAPVNSFVAGFLGLPPMNLLHGWHAIEGAKLQGELGTVAIPNALVGALALGQEVTLGFRSADASLVVEGAELPAGRLVIDAEVLNSEPNFGRGFQTVNVQTKDVIYSVQAPIDMPVNTGWLVRVVVSEEKAYLFDEESEARIAPPED